MPKNEGNFRLPGDRTVLPGNISRVRELLAQGEKDIPGKLGLEPGWTALLVLAVQVLDTQGSSS